VTRNFFLIGLFWAANTVAQVPLERGSKVSFQIKNFGVTVSGTFSGLKGDIQFDPIIPKNCSVNISINSKTIDTGIDLRDNHLMKEEYFDTDVYPTISFISQNLTVQDGHWKAEGKLTVKETTKEVSFPFKVVTQKDGYAFKGTFTLNRRDFGVGGRSFSIADDVAINFEVIMKR
jgi:polyisoprenoid-binding protein YceI